MTSTAQTASQKQIDYILALSGAKFVSQVFAKTGVPMTNAEERGDITKSRASEIIDQIKAR